MSNPTDHLIGDERASQIERYMQEVLSKRELLPPVALELALTTEALLLDRMARCELMAAFQK